MKKMLTDRMQSRREFERRAAEMLAEAQKTLLPVHAAEVIAINVESGEYLLASTGGEAWRQFRNRWPGALGYVCRVDGGPVGRFPGRALA